VFFRMLRFESHLMVCMRLYPKLLAECQDDPQTRPFSVHPTFTETESQLVEVFPDLHIIRSSYSVCVLEKHSNHLKLRDVRLSCGLG